MSYLYKSCRLWCKEDPPPMKPHFQHMVSPKKRPIIMKFKMKLKQYIFIILMKSFYKNIYYWRPYVNYRTIMRKHQPIYMTCKQHLKYIFTTYNDIFLQENIWIQKATSGIITGRKGTPQFRNIYIFITRI